LGFAEGGGRIERGQANGAEGHVKGGKEKLKTRCSGGVERGETPSASACRVVNLQKGKRRSAPEEGSQNLKVSQAEVQ